MSFVKLYKEKPALVFKPGRIDDNVQYAKALEAFIVVATDCLMINRRRRTAHLAWRRARPMPNQWWFIGGRMLPGEAENVAMSRRFERETRMAIDPTRFQLLSFMGRYLMKDRQQEPQDTPCDSLAFIFALDVSDEEISRIHRNLDSSEYESGLGLQEFTRDQLVAAGVFCSIIDAYDAAFPGP